MSGDRPRPKPGEDMSMIDTAGGKVEAISAGLGGNGGSAKSAILSGPKGISIA